MPASDKLLNILDEALVQGLLSKIKDGTAGHADFEVARKLLKDRGVQAGATAPADVLQLADALPTFEEFAEEAESA